VFPGVFPGKRGLCRILSAEACFWANSREKVAFVKCHCSDNKGGG